MNTSPAKAEKFCLSRRAFVQSHVGLVREGNEDACAVSGVAERVTSWSGLISSENGWALVADGVGGHVAGETASALAIEILRPMMSELRTDEDVQDAVNAADAALFTAMDLRPELRGMGTTIAGVGLRPGGAFSLSAGDSRVYAFKNGTLTQISIDDATKRGHLLQCLGGFQEPVPLFVHTHDLERDATILVCTDGLTNELTDAQIAEILTSRPPDPALALVDAALEAGGHDNVSVVVIEGGPGIAD